MRRRFLALVAAGALLAVAVTPASAITKNFVQDFDHPFVGLIAFYDSDWVFDHRCTGELLSPTVVLTAGHCVSLEAANGSYDGTLMAHARIWLQQGVGTNYDPAIQLDPVTGYPESCSGTGGDQLGILCAESSEMYSFGFLGLTVPDTRDLGIVILDQAIALPEYATLAPDATLDGLASARGTQDVTFTVSGYGISWSSGNGLYAVSYRERLMAESKLVNLQSRLIDGYGLQLNGNGDDRGGTCSGDSGGPVFYPADSNQVVAVTSWGFNAGCRGVDFYYRTDRQAVLDWIDSVAGL